MSNLYKSLIQKMASEYDSNGEIPSMYSEDFKKAICEKLLTDTTGLLYHHYRYLPLFERDYQFPELLQLISEYIKSDDDPDEEKRLSFKIAELLSKNVTMYFRQDIEDDIENQYRKEYKSNVYTYTPRTEQMEA
jgi:hypothetical protein